MRPRFFLLVAVLLAAVVLAPVGAGASEAKPTLDEISREVMCPSCGTTLDRSTSPAAERMRVYIQARIDEGWTKQQVLDGVVEEYGGDTNVLARTPTTGLGAVAWVVPGGVLLVALAVGVLSLRRWRQGSGSSSSNSSPSDSESES